MPARSSGDWLLTMATSAADDPIRADVEHWLHAIVDATIAAPVALVATVQRCIWRRAATVGERIRPPLEIARSLFDLAARPQSSPPAPPPMPVRRLAPVSEDASDDAGDLPIDEYESLAASHVVARLPSLTPAELQLVRRFEANHRGRRTVLGRIDQLLAAP
jgi:hypothetical protein